MLLRKLFNELEHLPGDQGSASFVGLLVSFFICLFTGLGGLASCMHQTKVDGYYYSTTTFSPYPTETVLLIAGLGALITYCVAALALDRTSKPLKAAFFLPLALPEGLLFGIYGFTRFVDQSLLTYGLMVLGSIIVAEIIFFADPQKPQKSDDRLSFTALVKAECYLDVLFGWVIVAIIVGAYQIINKAGGGLLSAVGDGVINYGVYPLIALAIGLVIYGYIYLNSLKFRKIPKEEPKVKEQPKEEIAAPNKFVNCLKCGQLNNVTLRTTCYYCSTTLPKEES